MRVRQSPLGAGVYTGLLALLVLSAPRLVNAAPPIPLQQFAAGPEMTAPALSPDGSKLVYLTTIAGERYVVVRDLQKGAPPRPVLKATSGTYEAFACNFKGNTRLLCRFEGVEHSYGAPYPASRMVVLNSDGSHVRVLFQSQAWTASIVENVQLQDQILHWLPDDPEHVLIQMADEESIFPSVFTLNVDSGVLHTLVGRHEPVMDWLVDGDGVVRFGYGYRREEALYIGRTGAKEQWRTLEKFKRFGGARYSPLAFGPLPNQLFVLAPQQKREAVWQMDLNENSDFQLIFSRPDVDVEGIETWPNDQHVVGFRYDDDKPHIEYIDPEAAAINRAMDKAVPNTFHEVVDVSRDGHLVLVHSYSDVEPGVYHALDMTKHELTVVGRSNTALSAATLAPSKPVLVPGPAGISIHGYLTLPPGTAGGQADRRGGVPTWRPVCPRRMGLRRDGAGHGQPRLRGAAAELPRLHRLWRGMAQGRAPGLGHDHAR